jgi:translation initiation factor 4A
MEQISDNKKTKKIESFDDIGLSENILRGIYAYGFEFPSEIQKMAILPLKNGKDLIAQAQSGTGKTGTFSIGLLEKIDTQKGVQAIILANTRELAMQIIKVITALGRYTDIKLNLAVGGSSVQNNKREIYNNNPNIIIGTPGRVLDLLKRKIIKNNNIQTVVIDEADEMLSGGFMEQIYNIFEFMPDNIQVGLFSATLPKEILDLTKDFLVDPVKILVPEEKLTLDGIKQYYIDVDRYDYKLDTLMDLFDALSVAQCIIYCNTKKEVMKVSDVLLENGHTVNSIHGEKDQEERKRIMEEFRKGSSRVLISTDLLARGIDVQQVSLVVNYDMPNNVENYIHRIGRSGRFGRKGVSINFVTYKERSKISSLENIYGIKIDELPSNIEEIIC